ncbi:dihydrofolate reductase family protein [Cysteiniphilum sp. QT6929]|uniref:dihydrofolate reductase family protein n=1 Tax=Cysteiniphilum sp. QT6929 TaxID=2975055 RepID=UPI0024B36FFF|nr:dihydrofolate reductase family protein [Cysteiniphilum sp. QT6929]WHN64656.1 dihydrofolate reductase family protein [Cysteiniphilum sp. QT6929]
MKLSVFIATSLDGYVARVNGDIDWLMKFNASLPADEDCGYADFISAIDTIVLGKNSFNKVLEFDQWPYANKRVIIMARSDVLVPDVLKNKVSVFSGTPKELVRSLNVKDANNLYIDGALIIQSFLNEGLIDELIVTVIPTLLGEGKSLFGRVNQDINLRLIDVKKYDFDAVQLKYAAIK